jgi:hypothetical protein
MGPLICMQQRTEETWDPAVPNLNGVEVGTVSVGRRTQIWADAGISVCGVFSETALGDDVVWASQHAGSLYAVL